MTSTPPKAPALPQPAATAAATATAAAPAGAPGTLWRNPLFDLAAFSLGLVLAWQLRWETGDLVWSLWLASLVVGYATIVLGIAGTIAGAVQARRSVLAALLGGVFLLAFFTVHFGMFHFVHSMFLRGFFPLGDGTSEAFEPALGDYARVVQRYWPWLLAAAIAERGALRDAWHQARRAGPAPDSGEITAGFNPMRAYVNVVRLHLLIFFFAFAAIAGLESFVVYAVVYAVYFFPWRLAFDRLRSAVG